MLGAATVVLVLVGALTTTQAASARATLKPSRGSLDRQNHQARAHDFTFLRSPADVRRFVQAGRLVPVRANRDYELHGVSFPYARPQVRDFLKHVGRGYRRACGERLVVTSLTRPRSRQPRHASSRSVHPTGMALDLRYPRRRDCRAWLEETLLYLESTGTIEASFEGRPPHYHLAVFPKPFTTFLARNGGSIEPAPSPHGHHTYRVRRGDNLWTIARRHKIDVRRLRTFNRLRGNLIKPGQVLQIPADR